MAKVSNPILSLLLATTLLLLGIAVSLQTDSASANESNDTQVERVLPFPGITLPDWLHHESNESNQAGSAPADSCVAAPPKAAAPKGHHWYYVTERQKGRKCWYLHSTLGHHAAERPHHTAARPRSTAAARHRSDGATSAASSGEPAAPEVAPPPDPNPQPPFKAASMAATVPMASAEATTPATSAAYTVDPQPPTDAAADGPQPHIEILRTVPISVPTQEAVQPSAPATQAAPAAQSGSTTAGSDAAGRADALQSNTRSDVKNVASATHDGAPDAESSGSEDAQQKPAEAPGPAETIATLQPTEMFFVVAIGLSMVVFLIAIATRIAAKHREPIITDYRYSAWSNLRLDLSQVDDAQLADEAMDEQWIDAEHDVPFLDPADDLREKGWIKRSLPARSDTKKPASSPAWPEPDAEGFAPVLRILRQA